MSRFCQLFLLVRNLRRYFLGPVIFHMLSKCFKSYLRNTTNNLGISVCSALLIFLVALKSWYFLGYDEIGRYFLEYAVICWYFWGFEVRVVAEPL